MHCQSGVKALLPDSRIRIALFWCFCVYISTLHHFLLWTLFILHGHCQNCGGGAIFMFSLS